MGLLYRFILAFHVIAIISWMAGILYLWRLFIYHTEDSSPDVRARLAIMEERLYRIITMPAMGLAIVLGLILILLNPALLYAGWLHLKLFFVLCLIGTTLFAGKLKRELKDGVFRFSSRALRIWNEIPTLLMILIVLLVIVKPFW